MMFFGSVSQVISGHLGWVRSIAVEPGNQWFVTGSGDRTIKVIYLTSNLSKENKMAYRVSAES